ncbi:winged helix-turn-helix domain-containing protein [Ferrimonas pelagia]|uniref:Winged helix-turn-helix domain-containing protein n=1 Tax=Ferrimonas pelagia TaxID=1177826 RepID=A0ABP9FEK2_9GAMM
MIITITDQLTLDCQNHHLLDLRSQQCTTLTEAESAVLLALYQHQDTVCSKGFLLEAGWPERIVAPSSLVQCICTLRKKLEPYPHLLLRTLPKQGYQLSIQPILAPENKQNAPPAQQATTAQQPPPSNPRPTSRTEPKLRTAYNQLSRFKSSSRGLLVLLLLCGIIAWHTQGPLPKWGGDLRWSEQIMTSLQFGAAQGPITLYTEADRSQALIKGLQAHLPTHPWPEQAPHSFNAFGSFSPHGPVLNLCPGEFQSPCSGQDLLNIAFPQGQTFELDMAEFIVLAKEMAQRHQFNRIELPRSVLELEQTKGPLTEEIYQADIYFPATDRLTIRADLTLSLVHTSKDKGLFSATLCLTDEDCLTTPVKYRLDGRFQRYEKKLPNGKVELFRIREVERDLEKPTKVTDGMLNFYRTVRRHSLEQGELSLYRLQQDKHSAVWGLDNGLTAWTKRTTLPL